VRSLEAEAAADASGTERAPAVPETGGGCSLEAEMAADVSGVSDPLHGPGNF
jgi:hypothetical protein